MSARSGPRVPGFAREAFAFFKDLAKNNNREWFHAHKDVYERSCRDALKALTVALDPPLGADRLTRINRDMRFARDKSAPYRTHVSTVVRGNYLSLSAEGLYVGTGHVHAGLRRRCAACGKPSTPTPRVASWQRSSPRCGARAIRWTRTNRWARHRAASAPTTRAWTCCG